ncbi:hypothetical protein GGS24DRAFT_498587 [Hypoxylon argillaceum]|nr:hypothetical protein GGS24DRAFT_498587 [Hypoxylon argillaceum]
MNNTPPVLAPEMVGWAPEPDGRGTMTLIWTCFLAIFTCTWSAIHTNLPAEGESSFAIFLRKVRWSLWAVYAAELELVTVAFLLCTAVTCYFWLRKALDVETHEHIYLKIPMTTVLLEAGHSAEKPFVHTSMDFVEQPGWFFWKRHPLFENFGGISGRPLRRIPNDFYDPPSTLRMALFLWVLSISHLGIHVLGWRFLFPTMVEWYLWQGASLGLLGIFLFSRILNVLSVIPGVGVQEISEGDGSPLRHSLMKLVRLTNIPDRAARFSASMLLQAFYWYSDPSSTPISWEFAEDVLSIFGSFLGSQVDAPFPFPQELAQDPRPKQ